MCDECLRGIPRQKQQVCPLCYAPREGGVVCCEKDLALDGVLVVAQFKEKSLLQRAIHDLKYNFVEDLAAPLGSLYAEILAGFEGEVVLCPVPLHVQRLRWRGFNQAELLAWQIGGRFRMQQLLTRTSFKKAQMELSGEERLKNVEGAFALRAEAFEAVPECVILVDDVATTLSTLTACASALKKAGVKKVFGVVLARVY